MKAAMLCLFISTVAVNAAVDLTTERSYAGVSMVDCVIALPSGGVILKTKRPESVFLENTFVRGAESIHSGGSRIASPAPWTRIDRYSSHTNGAMNLLSGVQSDGAVTMIAVGQMNNLVDLLASPNSVSRI